ncbi:MAG: beta-galactosidase, partial [Nitrospinae bacterium]|nr:beta-galactosidase [Nitrospinota bacterium]
MQTFYSGVYFHGPYHFNDNIAGMQDEFANFVAHNLNLVLVTNADWGEWGYATTAGNDNGIDVLLGTMNNCLPCCYCITSWSDHASLHSEVQSEILNHINTGASSLLGYYIWDEPTSADASNLGKLQQTLFEEDPVHPGTAILIGQQQMADCYAAMLPRDVMFIDVYPCEAGGLQGNFTNMYQRYEEMIDYIDRARGYIHTLDDTPLWIMLQTQDSTYDNAQSRPTVTEIRAMSWLALAHGAKGLLWFPWHNGQDSWAGLENPSESDEYTEITTISGNMNTMSAELVDLNITTNIASISGGGSEVTVPPTMQDNGFWIISSGATPTVRVDDADASDGKAIRMCNDTTWNTSWDTKWQWGDAGFVTGQNYDLYVRIKVDKNNSSGNAFSYGVWDESSQSQVIQGIVGANSMQDLVYKNIKIGTFIPDKDQYVYIAKTGNLNTPYIYVDKFWFDGSNVKIYDNGDVQTFIADSPFRRVETTHTTGQDSQFNLYNNAVRESDTSASDGYTAKMESSDTSWNLQWTWGSAGF